MPCIPACTYPSIHRCSLTSLARLRSAPFSFHKHIGFCVVYQCTGYYCQCTSCSDFFRRGLLRTTPLSPCLSRSMRRRVFYRETPRRKLLFEPFATLFLCLPRMAELPLDYLSKHFASPLAVFLRAEYWYDLAALRIEAKSTILRFCR
jgi:hypothetical protein